MAITKKELLELIEPSKDVEKFSSISSDGKTLLTRIPKDLVDELKINKGDRLLWVLNKKENNIKLILSRE